MKTVELKFMVDPAELGVRAFVNDPVRVVIVRPEALLFVGHPRR